MTAKFLFAGVLSAASIFAATLDVVYQGPVTGINVVRTINPTSVPGGSTSATTVPASLLSYNVLSGSTVIGSLLAYCAEPQQSTGPIGGPTITYDIDFTLRNAPGNTVPPGISAQQSADIQRLFSLFLNPFSAAQTPLNQAAMQVALWEIIRETSGSYNVGNGNVTFTDDNLAGVTAQAQALLASLPGATPNTNLVFLTDSVFQDLISDVPEPSTFAMMGLALAPLAYLAHRRRKA